ncbi:MAG: hypothetical protein ABRQ24_10140, partial [Syntrophomonadaceae bacterium]
IPEIDEINPLDHPAILHIQAGHDKNLAHCEDLLCEINVFKPSGLKPHTLHIKEYYKRGPAWVYT